MDLSSKKHVLFLESEEIFFLCHKSHTGSGSQPVFCGATSPAIERSKAEQVSHFNIASKVKVGMRYTSIFLNNIMQILYISYYY